MAENRVSITISAADVVEITKAIEVLSDKLAPILIALTADDRQSMAKIKDATIPFMEKIVQYLESNPEFAPPYLDKDETKKDFAAFTVLNAFIRPLSQITRNLEDTAMLCGSEAYANGRSYYKSVVNASDLNVLGAKAIYDDLKVRFESQKAKLKKAKEIVN